ncbi:MAG: hypothetical protein AB7S78_02515 [Candidatus Omnitrophota bacterium]
MDRHESSTQQRQYLRRLKPYQRIQLAFELHDLARSRVSGEIKRRHPDLTKEELLKKLNERFIQESFREEQMAFFPALLYSTWEKSKRSDS